MKNLYSNSLLILITFLLIISGCNYFPKDNVKSDKEIENNKKLRFKKSVIDKSFKQKKLFLNFWSGMSYKEYNIIKTDLIDKSILTKDSSTLNGYNFYGYSNVTFPMNIDNSSYLFYLSGGGKHLLYVMDNSPIIFNPRILPKFINDSLCYIDLTFDNDYVNEYNGAMVYLGTKRDNTKPNLNYYPDLLVENSFLYSDLIKNKFLKLFQKKYGNYKIEKHFAYAHYMHKEYYERSKKVENIILHPTYRFYRFTDWKNRKYIILAFGIGESYIKHDFYAKKFGKSLFDFSIRYISFDNFKKEIENRTKKIQQQKMKDREMKNATFQNI